MNPEEIRDLAGRGHAVGTHTFSHIKLAGLSPAELNHEIVEGAAKVTSWTGQPVEAFAWTFGWDAIDRPSWDLIRQHHRFCFAPCPGTVSCGSDSPHLIWRKEVEVRYSISEFKFMYSGLVDLLWRAKRRRLRDLLLNTARVEADV